MSPKDQCTLTGMEKNLAISQDFDHIWKYNSSCALIVALHYLERSY